MDVCAAFKLIVIFLTLGILFSRLFKMDRIKNLMYFTDT